MGEESTCNAGAPEDESSVPGTGRFPLEEEMAPHSSILAWRILWPEEPGGLQSVGVAKSRKGKARPARLQCSLLGPRTGRGPAGRLAFLERPGHGAGVPWEALPALNRGAAMLTHGCYPRVMGACSRGLVHAGCWSRGEGRESQPAPSERSPGSELAWPAPPIWHRRKFRDQQPNARAPHWCLPPEREALQPGRRDAALWGDACSRRPPICTILFCF